MTTTTPTPRILVVDDDRAVRTAIRVNLSKQGWDVSVAEDAEGALKLIADRHAALLQALDAEDQRLAAAEPDAQPAVLRLLASEDAARARRTPDTAREAA